MRKFIVAAAVALSVFVLGFAYNSPADEYYYGVTPGQLKKPWQGQYDAPSTTIIKKREHREHRVYYVDPDDDVVEYRYYSDDPDSVEYRYYSVDPDSEYRYEYHYRVEPDNDVEYYYYYDD